MENYLHKYVANPKLFLSLVLIACVCMQSIIFGQTLQIIVARQSEQVRVDQQLFFDPDHAPDVHFVDHTGDFLIQSDPKQLRLQVARQGNKTKSSVLLPIELAQAKSIHRLANGNVAVLGMANGAVWMVVLVDTRTWNVYEKFLCYAPAVSPDGKHIAFVKFFPPHFLDNEEDHYMLYDVMKTAAQNRPRGVKRTNVGTVGTTIYPLGMGNRDGDNTNLDRDDLHAFKSEKLFWTPDSKAIVFADSYKDKTMLVWASVNREVRQSLMPFTTLCSDGSKTKCNMRLTNVLIQGTNLSLEYLVKDTHGSTKKTIDMAEEQMERIQSETLRR